MVAFNPAHALGYGYIAAAAMRLTRLGKQAGYVCVAVSRVQPVFYCVCAWKRNRCRLLRY
jgi:hypothetical protein